MATVTQQVVEVHRRLPEGNPLGSVALKLTSNDDGKTWQGAAGDAVLDGKYFRVYNVAAPADTKVNPGVSFSYTGPTYFPQGQSCSIECRKDGCTISGPGVSYSGPYGPPQPDDVMDFIP